MKTKHSIILALAAVILPLTWANAARDYQFNGSSNNEVGGVLDTINTAPGQQITVSLQVALSGADATQAVDYWLSQFSGPAAGVFSIVGRDYTSSIFPDPSATNGTVTASTDTRTNSAASGAADGVPDNQINPQNGFDLGSSVNDATDRSNGTFQVATFTLQVAGNAAPGTYELRTFDYSGFGIGDVTPDNQAAINVDVAAVPEPATLSLLLLGGLGSFGANFLRGRRRLS